MKSSIRQKPKSPQELSKIALSKIKDQDKMHRGFLKPIQIALKTFKTQYNVEGNKLKSNSLPSGLKIVVKESINMSKYELANVEEIDQNDSFQVMKSKNQNNILSLMKNKAGIQLAICVCMYSQDKKMLKSTLAGIQQNIANIVSKTSEKQNITSDKIGVFILMDGIQKIDQSVVEYFEELQRKNSINLGQNVVQAISIDEMAKKSQTMTVEQMQEEQIQNVNSFLFDVAELEERNKCRFPFLKEQYQSIKNLQKEIQKLKKKKPLYEDLPLKLQAFFIEQARKQRQEDYGQSQQEVKGIPQKLIIDEYASDLKKIRPIILKALNQAGIYCQNYINNRQDLAYLVSYRSKIMYGADKTSVQGGRQRNFRYHDENTKDQSKYMIKQDDIDQEQYFTYMNLFICVKYKNSGKLSSHNWFFNGFCKELKPKYAVLLDVGLRPQGQALHKMYKYMVKNQKIGGVCGYMSLKLQRIFQNEQIKDDEVDFLTNIALKFSDIQRTQQVEYHFAHLIDKPFEASFGFIHVLPGAFSAYNMKAIFNYEAQDDDELLKSYFKSIDDKIKNNTIKTTHLSVGNVITRVVIPDFVRNWFVNIDQESDQQMLYNENIYLAEDRILCMGIHKKNFDMAYLPDAYAEVDPIKTVHGLLGQRKRWINGSFFAFEKVKKELSQHQKIAGCECMLHLQMFYLTLMNSLSYFAPSLFLFTVHIAMEAFRADVLTKVLGGVVPNPEKSEFYNSFVYTVDFIYVMLVGSIIFYSLHLTNNNKKFKPYIYAVSTLFGIFAIVVFCVLVVDVIRGLTDNSTFLQTTSVGEIPGGIGTINALRWILIASTLIYVIPIFVYIALFGKARILFEIMLGAFSFLFYGPTYLNILNIYSLSRIDDISWGTKGLDSGGPSKNSSLKDSWSIIKHIHVIKYVLWNIIIGTALVSLGSSYQPRFFITIIMIGLMGMSLSLKIIVALIYIISYKLKNRCCAKDQNINLKQKSKISVLLKDKFFPDVEKQIANHLNNIKDEYVKSNVKFGSFIQASTSKKLTQKAYQKKKTEHLNASKIIGKKTKKYANTSNLPSIPQQESQKKPIPPKRPTFSTQKLIPAMVATEHKDKITSEENIKEIPSPLKSEKSDQGFIKMTGEKLSVQKKFQKKKPI